MGTIVISGTVVLVVLGFDNHIWWLAAVGVLFMYMQYGRGSSSASSSSGGSASGPPSPATPASYKAYRDRRDRQAKWERRYRRERPWSPAARHANRASNLRSPAHRPGAPQIGNQRPRSCSIRRSSVSAALICNSSALSRRWPSPASGAKG